MGHKQLQIRKHLPQPCGNLFDSFNPRHHVKHLSATIQFLPDGTANRFRIEGCKVGLDRSAQRGWCGDQAHLPHTGEAHVKRSRDRGCRQGQHVHVLA